MSYVELQAASHFSFLRAASSCEQLFARAAELGLKALALTDHNTLSGMVRAHQAARETGVRLIVGCRLELNEGATLLVYPTDRAAYGRLCRLLSLGKARAGKGRCDLGWDDLGPYAEGLIAVLVAEKADPACAARLARAQAIFSTGCYLALSLKRRPKDTLRLHRLKALADSLGLACVAVNDVLYHHPDQRILQEVMSAIRHNCRIEELGLRRERSADRHLKSEAEMRRLFAAWPDAVEMSGRIAEACQFSLDELAYQYPLEEVTAGRTPQETLCDLVAEGAKGRYPDGVPDKVKKALAHELALIGQMAYAPYFLTVNAIVRFARSQGILCQGRGSAANSAVCYVLGITAIDPEKHELLFERFISQERKEPPDIDVDFEHERRETVMQWVFETYGRTHAALCSTVIRYRARGALRDVGKALGLPEDLIRLLSSQVWAWSREGVEAIHLQSLNLNPHDARLMLTLDLARRLMGTPRHLSQHPGGFVLTEDRLDELVPIEPAAMSDRQVIEWDKDDIDILKFMKVDCLALGMLSCMKRSFDLIAEQYGQKLDLADIPQEDEATYAMIRRADTLGVFQIESRAQMAMLPRIKPRTFYDLVIEVAIVRPGPIQGDMVHPYLLRREGKERPSYPSPELERVLGRTLGVPLFQEQAMRVVIECAGFTPSEADQLRRAMATFKHTGGVGPFRDKLIFGMTARGYTQDFAERTFRQLEGFGSYGFPESHAASFALIAYASSWVKRHYPDVFCAALLNAQPMGFYAPAQIVRDAREHGVEVRPVSVLASRWDCTLEAGRSPNQRAVRLGFRQVRGLANADAAKIIAARGDGRQGEDGFSSVSDVWRRSGVRAAALVKIAEADGFLEPFGLARREALWAIKALNDQPLPLFDAADAAAPLEDAPRLRPMSEGREVVEDYAHLGLTLRRHPLAFLRARLAKQGFRPCAETTTRRDGALLSVAGLVLVRQKPGSANGVMFITLEDETGVANLVVWPKLFEKLRRVILTSRLMAVDGRLQREGEVAHLIVYQVHDLTDALDSLGRAETPGPAPRDLYSPDMSLKRLRQKARNFH